MNPSEADIERKEYAAKIASQAKNELESEEFRLQVELEKAHLRKRQTFWRRLFPWRLVRIAGPKDTYEEFTACLATLRSQMEFNEIQVTIVSKFNGVEYSRRRL